MNSDFLKVICDHLSVQNHWAAAHYQLQLWTTKCDRRLAAHSQMALHRCQASCAYTPKYMALSMRPVTLC